MGQYSVLVDLMGHSQLGGKTVLYLLDGIIVSPSEGSTASVNSDNTRWQSEPFSGGFTASLFFSQDPVAIDSVGADFLANEPALQKYNSVIRNNPNVENYIHEAASPSHAPSGTVYHDDKGRVIQNLGVHEHWNSSREKLYSRNLGKSKGIELVQLMPERRALVIYYSWSGNTRRAAERLASLTGADIYEVRTLKVYPKDGRETANISREERRTGRLPDSKIF